MVIRVWVMECSRLGLGLEADVRCEQPIKGLLSSGVSRSSPESGFWLGVGVGVFLFTETPTPGTYAYS